MDFKEYEYNREQKKAYRIFTEDALIDIIVRKNKQIEELQTKLFALPAVSVSLTLSDNEHKKLMKLLYGNYK